jgi:outer membrane protein assembly factor BamB
VGSALESAVVANGVVYVTSANGGLFAFDARTGTVVAGGQAGASLFGNPTVSDGVVYLNTYGGDLYAFGLLAGTSAVHAQQPVPASLHPDMGLAVKHS